MARGSSKSDLVAGLGIAKSKVADDQIKELKNNLRTYLDVTYDDEKGLYSIGRKMLLYKNLNKLPAEVLKSLAPKEGVRLYRGDKQAAPETEDDASWEKNISTVASFSTEKATASEHGKRLYTNEDMESYAFAVSIPKLMDFLGWHKEGRYDDVPDDVKSEVFVAGIKWRDNVDSASWKREETKRRGKI